MTGKERMRKIIIPDVREVCYMKRVKDCNPDEHKEIYSKTLIRATTHNEAMALFRKYVADESVADIVTTRAVYIYIRDEEKERLEWM